MKKQGWGYFKLKGIVDITQVITDPLTALALVKTSLIGFDQT